MTEKAWFAWEMDFANRWNPVVYHMEKPKTRKHEEGRRTRPIEVPEDCLDMDGSPHFHELMKRYPAPREKEESDG